MCDVCNPAANSYTKIFQLFQPSDRNILPDSCIHMPSCLDRLTMASGLFAVRWRVFHDFGQNDFYGLDVMVWPKAVNNEAIMAIEDQFE
ncbi:hypothetical protein Pse7367_1976 [Thalassoporum mexicanum PCC 7367]|nr:hypothetical protein Pse7367_1976 [Pseudanabaena sp. PCC 7367]